MFSGSVLWHQIGNTDSVIQKAANKNMVYQVQKQHGRWLFEEKSEQSPSFFLALVAYVVVRGKRDRDVSSCASSGLSLEVLQKITGGNSAVGALESRDSLVRYGGSPALFHV